MIIRKILAGLFSLFSFAAIADDGQVRGMASRWQLGLQDAASPVMEQLKWIHDNILLAVCVGVSAFVFVVLLYICVRFRRKNNPIASKTSHNTRLEIIWTAVPILILLVIAIPSLRLHYFMERDSRPELTIKVVGYQWYWGYEYPDIGGIKFDSYLLKDKDLKDGDARLLSVDNHLVVPVDTNVRLLLTGADVIHSFAVPAFGIKRDAVPGRLNETWFKATKIGTFYGQCSELCGVGHGFMPIAIDVVSKDDFDKWIAAKKK